MIGYRMLVLTVFLALPLCIPGFAAASWSQDWYENGIFGDPATHYDITKYEVFIVSDPTITEWESLTPAKADWAGTIVSPTYSMMTGPAASSLNFQTVFSGDKYPGISLDFVAWSGSEIVGATRIGFTGGYTFQELLPGDLPNYNRSPVPVPASAVLLVSGLIGLIGIKRSTRHGLCQRVS